MAMAVQGVRIPDSQLAREITDFVRDTAPALLYHHSSRVYYFGALAGKHRDLRFDPELLYAGAMFHDRRLMPAYSTPNERFEVDGANAARDFLKQRGIDAGVMRNFGFGLSAGVLNGGIATTVTVAGCVCASG